MTRFRLAIPALVFSSFALASTASAQGWVYKEVQDKFTDKRHIIATNNAERGFKVSFECREGRDFVFTLDANRDLGPKGRFFKFLYRASGKKTKTVRMVTFSNSNTGGMNKSFAVDIANDFLNADKMIVRAVSTDNDEYDGEVSLAGAYEPIVRTVVACGMAISE